MNGLRPNVIALAFLGIVFIVLLAFMTQGSPNAQTAVLAIGGTFVGGFAGIMTRLVEPPRDPAVPASVLDRLLLWSDTATVAAEGGGQIQGASGTVDLVASHSPWRGNVIVLSIIAGVVMVIVLWMLPGEGALVTVAGGLIGGLISLASKLVDPPPDPEVPASIIKHVIGARTIGGADTS